MKLTTLQFYKLDAALHMAAAVLNDVKRLPLKGESLTFMKTLEAGIQALEVARIMAPAKPARRKLGVDQKGGGK